MSVAWFYNTDEVFSFGMFNHEPDADDLQNLMSSSLFTDLSLAKFL